MCSHIIVPRDIGLIVVPTHRLGKLMKVSNMLITGGILIQLTNLMFSAYNTVAPHH